MASNIKNDRRTKGYTTDQQLDLHAIEEHARTISLDGPHLIQPFPDTKERRRTPSPLAGPPRSLVPALHHCQERGFGIGIAINQFSGARRRSDEVSKLRGVFADLDGTGLPVFPIPPTMTTETSSGNYQCLWGVSHVSLAAFKAVQHHLVVYYGADPRAVDVARVMRLAGTWNLKANKNFRVQIRHNTGLYYTEAELLDAFPPVSPARSLDAKRHEHTPVGDLGILADYLRLIPADEYQTWIQVGMALHAETNGTTSGLSVWDEWSASSSKYRPGECARRWKSFGKRSGITGATIIHLARLHSPRPNQSRG